MAGASSGVESDVADPPPGQSDVHQRQKGAHPADGETIRQTQIQETHGESRKEAEGRFE